MSEKVFSTCQQCGFEFAKLEVEKHEGWRALGIHVDENYLRRATSEAFMQFIRAMLVEFQGSLIATWAEAHEDESIYERSDSWIKPAATELPCADPADFLRSCSAE